MHARTHFCVKCKITTPVPYVGVSRRLEDHHPSHPVCSTHSTSAAPRPSAVCPTKPRPPSTTASPPGDSLCTTDSAAHRWCACTPGCCDHAQFCTLVCSPSQCCCTRQCGDPTASILSTGMSTSSLDLACLTTFTEKNLYRDFVFL